MNPVRSRISVAPSARSAAATLALSMAASLVLAGCSAGQISQSADQEPAVNGSNVWVGPSTTGIALRNVHVRAPQLSDFVRPGARGELLFAAINESADQPDRLVSITSPVAEVTLAGDLRLPAGGTLLVGTPDGQPSPLDATEGAQTAQAGMTLTQPISNGLTYAFTFTFERSGSAEVDVPISAGQTSRRDAEPTVAEAGDSAAVEAGTGTGTHP